MFSSLISLNYFKFLFVLSSVFFYFRSQIKFIGFKQNILNYILFYVKYVASSNFIILYKVLSYRPETPERSEGLLISTQYEKICEYLYPPRDCYPVKSQILFVSFFANGFRFLAIITMLIIIYFRNYI